MKRIKKEDNRSVTCRGFMAAVGLVLLGGCRLPPREFAFRPERAERYLASHAEVQDPVAEALRQGRVVKGMTEKEVRICMGSPREKKRVNYGRENREVWFYGRPYRERGDLERSNMWHRDIPTARVVFDEAGRVLHCQMFGRRPPLPGTASDRQAAPRRLPAGLGPESGGTDDTHHLPRDTMDDPPGPLPGGDRGAPEGRLPSSEVGNGVSGDPGRGDVTLAPVPATKVRPKAARKGEFNNWPSLQVSGVSSGGGAATAIINRQVVSKGDRVAGVEVLDVTPMGVRLRYRDDIQFLPFGETTD